MPLSGFTRSMRVALRHAPSFLLPPGIVDGCIDSGHDAVRHSEELFRTAYESSLQALDRAERHAVGPVTGHVAESVAAVILDELGWHVVEQFVSPRSGGHGIDLAMLSPQMDRLFAVEVKGTLQEQRWPRLSRGEFDQMTRAWLDKPDNPGMSELGVLAEDIYGLVIFIQFRQRRWKAAITTDFERASGVGNAAQLADLVWLE